jgi:hypothetical protein
MQSLRELRRPITHSSIDLFLSDVLCFTKIGSTYIRILYIRSLKVRFAAVSSVKASAAEICVD